MVLNVLVGPINVPGEFVFSANQDFNPGMGGSEFHSIRLAQILSDSFRVTLWINNGSVSGLPFEVVDELKPEVKYDVQISHTSARSIGVDLMTPLISVSHHPFDGALKNLSSRTVAIVNVGRYQLLTNAKAARRRGVAQFWMPITLAPPLSGNLPEKDDSRFTVGHLSSLHPSKGFHGVLKGWMKFVGRRGNSGRLRVIGGIGIYGFQENHPTLPVERTFGAKLQKTLSRNRTNSVDFLGRVKGSISLELSQWDVALLNPWGVGEAAPVSIKDCWRHGVPVVAGRYFGQRDYMDSFPELVPSLSRSIPVILSNLEQNTVLVEELKSRALESYAQFYNLGQESKRAWPQLVKALCFGTPALGVPDRFVHIGITSSQRFAVWRDAAVLRVIRTASSVVRIIGGKL